MGSAQRTTETFSDLEQRLHVISQQNSVLREMLGRFQGTVDHACIDGGLSPHYGWGQFCLLLFFLFSQEKHDGVKSKKNCQLESMMSNLCSSSPRCFAI